MQCKKNRIFSHNEFLNLHINAAKSKLVQFIDLESLWLPTMYAKPCKYRS